MMPVDSTLQLAKRVMCDPEGFWAHKVVDGDKLKPEGRSLIFDGASRTKKFELNFKLDQVGFTTICYGKAHAASLSPDVNVDTCVFRTHPPSGT